MTEQLLFNERVLLITSLALYSVAWVLYFVSARRNAGFIASAPRSALIAGLAANLAALVLRWGAVGYAPFANLFGSLVFFACALAVVNVFFELLYRARLLGAVSMPFALSLLAYALFGVDMTPRPLMPALRSAWLQVHVSAYFFGYAALAVSFAAAVIDLVQVAIHRRRFSNASHAPSGATEQRRVDYTRVTHRAVALGFPFLTLGLVTGSIWAKQAWGDYWQWDPKETWSLITWLVYLTYLHLPWLLPRVAPGAAAHPFWGRFIRTVALFVGFAVVLFTYLGMHLLPSADKSLHIYGSP